MAETVRIAAVQLEPALGDVEANLDACARLAAAAADQGAWWIVLEPSRVSRSLEVRMLTWLEGSLLSDACFEEVRR